MKPLFSFLFCILILPLSGQAEIIQLTNGKAIQTEILEESDESVLVKAYNGRVRIPKSQVTNIFRGEMAQLLEVRNQRLYFAKGVSLYEKGQFKDAAQEFQRSLNSGDRAAVHINLGSALAAIGDSSKAEDNYLKAIQDTPHSWKAFMNLGHLYLATHRYEKAVEAFKKAISIEPQEEVLEPLAYAEYALGNYKEAIQLYDQMENRNNLYILNNKAAAYIQEGQFDQAEEILSKITKENPTFNRGILNLALLARKRQDFEKAEVYYNALLQRDESNKEIWMAYGEFNLEKEDPEEAEKAFQKVLEIEPKSIEALNALYSLMMKQNNPEEAKKYLDQMSASFPDQSDIQDQVGIFYLKTKQPEKALAVFEKIITTWPERAQSYTHRGLAYAFLGKTEEAMQSWRKALEIDSNQKAALTNLTELETILKGSLQK